MRKTVSAFTLVELLVVVSIFTIITGVILANHSRFNSSTLLGSLAYDIALSVREAQVYGLSVSTYNPALGTSFSPTGYNIQVGYGVHFDSTDATHYILFADVNHDKQYDAGDTALQTYAVGSNYFIKSFCGTLATGVAQCTSGTGTVINRLDIVFFRPDPDASISSSATTAYSRGGITVASPSGGTRTVTIQSTGQISVTNP